LNTLSLQRLIGITVGLFFCLTAANAQSDNARPQLSAEQAAAYSYANVLNTGSQRWDPRSDRLLSEHAIKPDYIVDQSAAETSASVFRSLQSCINRIVIDTEHVATRRRVYILLKPGTYHELLYLPPMPVALTVYGIGTDPGQTRIAADLDATITGSDYLHQFEKQFAGVDAQTRAMVSTVASRPFIGTDGTAVAWIQNEGFQAKNITIQNTYSMPADCLRSGCHEGNVKGGVVHHQAVALMLDGADKSQFEQVRVLGHQDTLYMKTSTNPILKATLILFSATPLAILISRKSSHWLTGRLRIWPRLRPIIKPNSVSCLTLAISPAMAAIVLTASFIWADNGFIIRNAHLMPM